MIPFETISELISIIDLADEFGIDLEEKVSGNFDYRCKCPSVNHKNGLERTGSLYISSEGNNFYCFGCKAGQSSIDFYMLCTGKDFSTAVRELADRIPKDAAVTKKEFKPRNTKILLKMSELFRTKLQNNPNKESLTYISKIMEKADHYLESIRDTEIEKTEKLLAALNKELERFK